MRQNNQVELNLGTGGAGEARLHIEREQWLIPNRPIGTRGESDEMVGLPGIRFVSHCEHHVGADVGRAQFDHESAKELVEPKPGWRFFT
jgi:hypothetical protein